ncbi:MAG: cache domain-containing protein, partial [Oscillospiraceae bacterium]|nr:cache domain-containing protein [Oscillospiraceae bacterium]
MASGKKHQKLSTKFALTCVLPASLLLVAVCIVSLMLTSKNLLHSIQKSLESQGKSRIQTMTEDLTRSVNSAGFQSRVSDIQRLLKNEKDDEIQDILFQMATRSSCFEEVSLYDFTDNTVYSPRSKSSFSHPPVWYDEERFIKTDGYFITQNITRNADLTLIYYVYPFKSLKSDVNDRCFVASVRNELIIRQLGLTNELNESKWMIVSDDGRIIYHSDEYNHEVFSAIEEKIRTEAYEPYAVHKFNGTLVLVIDRKIPKVDNIRILYVAPVERALKDSNQSLVIMVVLTVFSICILAFFIGLMTKKMVTEINAIRNSLGGIKEKKYVGVIKNETHDEIGDLVDDFNKVISLLTYQAEHDENTGFYNSRAFARKARKIVTEN